jgi:hypothetical protein
MSCDNIMSSFIGIPSFDFIVAGAAVVCGGHDDGQ